jgi:hypothetical protein
MVAARHKRAQPTALTLVKPHTGGQRALYLHPARFQVVACGRRWGKTEFGRLVAIEGALRYGLPVWWISPTYKMSRATWRELYGTLAPFAVEVSVSDKMMYFANGGSLMVWSATAYDTMRGGAAGIIIVDEAAMVKSGDMWNAALRPALTDLKGRALFLSTPRGRNWFYDLYVRGLDPLQSSYKSWNFPTTTSPLLDPEEIAEARLSLPERAFRQEYLAEFLDDAGGVFRGVADVSYLDERNPYGGRFVFGVDWGRENDFTVIQVIDRDSGQQVASDRFREVSWEVQIGRLKVMYEAWRPEVIWAEHNSIGSVLIEQLQRGGLPIQPFVTTAQSKAEIIDALSLAIERGTIALLNDRVQVAELQAFEMTRTQAGNYRYAAPDGGHDDMVMALAIAWHGVTRAPRLIGSVIANPFYD